MILRFLVYLQIGRYICAGFLIRSHWFPMFYFNHNPNLVFAIQPLQQVEWIVFRINELKRSLLHYIRLTLAGVPFVDVIEFIAAQLNLWYEEIFAILRDANMMDFLPLLDIDWPLTDFM